MNIEDHDEFLSRIAKTLYYGNTSSFDSVSLPLTELAAELYNEVKKDSGLERLQVREVAEFNQNACVSTCSLVLAILYLEKMKLTSPDYIEKVTPSELLLVSLLIASKFLNDDVDEEVVLNSEWAVCAGISIKRMNRIEKQFLQAINWELFVSDKVFYSRLLHMEKYLASREGRRRGWYSYTELDLLLCDKSFACIKDFISCYIVCCISYTASVLSMIGFGLLTLHIKDIFVNNVSLDVFNAEFALTKICSSSVIDTFNVTSTLISSTFDNSTDISNDLLLEESELCNVKSLDTKNDCDNSSSSCCFSNISSDRLSFSIKLPSTYAEILKMLQRSKKSNVIKKKSLVYTKYA